MRLFGVNLSGQALCAGADHDIGVGIFDGPFDDRSITFMKAWHINAVRIQLNESCWLGINGSGPQYSDPNYGQPPTPSVMGTAFRTHLIQVASTLSFEAGGRAAPGHSGNYHRATTV